MKYLNRLNIIKEFIEHKFDESIEDGILKKLQELNLMINPELYGNMRQLVDTNPDLAETEINALYTHRGRIR